MVSYYLWYVKIKCLWSTKFQWILPFITCVFSVLFLYLPRVGFHGRTFNNVDNFLYTFVDSVEIIFKSFYFFWIYPVLFFIYLSSFMFIIYGFTGYVEELHIFCSVAFLTMLVNSQFTGTTKALHLYPLSLSVMLTLHNPICCMCELVCILNTLLSMDLLTSVIFVHGKVFCTIWRVLGCYHYQCLFCNVMFEFSDCFFFISSFAVIAYI